MRAEILRFPDEIRSPKEIGLPKPGRVPKPAVQRLARIVRNKAAKDISRQEMLDEQAEKLLKLVERKQARRKDVVEIEAGERKPAKVVDLMEVLKKSLAGKRAA